MLLTLMDFTGIDVEIYLHNASATLLKLSAFIGMLFAVVLNPLCFEAISLVVLSNLGLLCLTSVIIVIVMQAASFLPVIFLVRRLQIISVLCIRVHGLQTQCESL